METGWPTGVRLATGALSSGTRRSNLKAAQEDTMQTRKETCRNKLRDEKSLYSAA
jgi:hypothetical protein